MFCYVHKPNLIISLDKKKIQRGCHVASDPVSRNTIAMKGFAICFDGLLDLPNKKIESPIPLYFPLEN